jgi:uncharacterized membrane protein
MLSETVYILLTIVLFLVLFSIFSKKRERTSPLKSDTEGDFQKKAKTLIEEKKKNKN